LSQSRTQVSACIVTHHSYEPCRAAVRSLLEQTRAVDLTLYVVDNHSQDDSLQRLADEFPDLVPIQNSDNRGFGNGHNTLLPLIDSEYHVIVNPDIEIDRDVIGELCLYLDDHPDIGLITPMIRYPDGRDQQLPKRDPTVLSLVGRHLFKRRLKPIVEHYQMLDEDLSQVCDIEFATGCFFVIRTDLFRRLGGFDERWFMYYEDMDITRRARAQMRAVYYPHTCVYHIWARSSSRKLKYFLMLVAGMFKYFHKWGWKISYPTIGGKSA